MRRKVPRTPPIRGLVIDEHVEQVNFFQWLDFEATKIWPKLAVIDSWQFEATKNRLKRPRYRLPVFAIPNGGHRAIKTAKDLKAEGVRSGVLDVFLAVPIGGKAGLWIEMKMRKGAYASQAQKEWKRVFEVMGYRVEICKGKDEAVKAVTDYLGGHDG